MVTTLVKMLRFMEAEPSQRERLFLEFVDALPPNGVKPVWLGDTHDETAKGHGSLTNKMPGNQQDKFANVRLFASFNAGQPGARSTFMTTLLAQSEEWHGRVFRSTTNPDENERKTTSMQWEELDQTVNPLNWRYHVGMGRLSSHLNELFLKHPVLSDASAESLKSIQCDSIHTVMARYRSKEGHSPVLMIQNFSGEALPNYQINLGELRNLKRVKLIFNSNDQKFFRHWLKEDDDFIAKDPHLAAPPPEFKLIGDVMIVSSLPPYSAFMIEGKL